VKGVIKDGKVEGGYRIGVDARPGTKFRVILDSDRRDFGGTGQLSDQLPHLTGGVITVENEGDHGKPHSIRLPSLAPYQTVIMEQE
jgi:hypothetical protein